MPSQRGSPKVVSQDSLDVLQRGQPAQLHWKDFFTLPYAKKNGWFWEAKQLLSWFLFQPASHLGLPEGVSYISQWNPTEKGLDTFEQSRHAVDKILHQLPWKEISHDSQCFHQWLTEFSPINHSFHLMPSVSCFPFPQTTGKPDIEQAGVQLELAQAMEARNPAIWGGTSSWLSISFDVCSLRYPCVFGSFLSHRKKPRFLWPTWVRNLEYAFDPSRANPPQELEPKNDSYWVHGTCHILCRKLVDWFSGTENSSEVHFTNLSLNFNVTQHLFLALVFASWICNNTGMPPKKEQLPAKSSNGGTEDICNDSLLKSL